MTPKKQVKYKIDHFGIFTGTCKRIATIQTSRSPPETKVTESESGETPTAGEPRGPSAF